MIRQDGVMEPTEVAVRIVVDLLVRGEYETVEAMDRADRLTASDLREAVGNYGRTLTRVPDDWWRVVEVTQSDGQPAFLHVAAPLWTQEEGRSDLVLEVRLDEQAPGGIFSVSVQDLHVL